MSVREPEPYTPPWWNRLALDTFEQLKPLVEATVDPMVEGGYVAPMKPVTLAMLRKMDAQEAIAQLVGMLEDPYQHARGMELFDQFLRWVQREAEGIRDA